MAETKPIASHSEPSLNAGERKIRTYEEALTATDPPPTPTQEEADAIKDGTYSEEAPPPEGETAAAKKRREEREAKAAADSKANYQTR